MEFICQKGYQKYLYRLYIPLDNGNHPIRFGDNRDDFDFSLVNILILSINIPFTPWIKVLMFYSQFFGLELIQYF